MEYLDVAFTLCGEKGLPLLAAAVRSTWESCAQPERLRIHLLWWDIGEDSLTRLVSGWEDYLSHFHLYSAGSHLPELASQSRYGFWYRIWLGRVLGPEVERLLYLDCDVLVRGDISELWALDMRDALAAVVWDPAQRVEVFRQPLVENGHRFGFPFRWEDPYFNSGVLFLNLKKWREERIGDTIHRVFFGKTEWSRFNDQDPLNLVLNGRTKPLSPSWNLIETVPYYRKWDYQLYRDFGPPDEYFEPKIRHFAGSQKPETLWARWSHKVEFYGYLQRCGWLDENPLERSPWWRRLLSQLVELHYLVCRGLLQRALNKPLPRLCRLLLPRPHLFFCYFLFLAYLWFRGEPE